LDRELPSHVFLHGNRFRVQKMIGARLVRQSFESLDEATTFLDGLLDQISQERAQDLARATRGTTIGDIVREWWEGPAAIPVEHRRGHRDRVSHRTLNQVAEFLGHSPRRTLELYGWTLDREALKHVGETVVTLVDIDGMWGPSD